MRGRSDGLIVEFGRNANSHTSLDQWLKVGTKRTRTNFGQSCAIKDKIEPSSKRSKRNNENLITKSCTFSSRWVDKTEPTKRLSPGQMKFHKNDIGVLVLAGSNGFENTVRNFHNYIQTTSPKMLNQCDTIRPKQIGDSRENEVGFGANGTDTLKNNNKFQVIHNLDKFQLEDGQKECWRKDYSTEVVQQRIFEQLYNFVTPRPKDSGKTHSSGQSNGKDSRFQSTPDKKSGLKLQNEYFYDSDSFSLQNLQFVAEFEVPNLFEFNQLLQQREALFLRQNQPNQIQQGQANFLEQFDKLSASLQRAVPQRLICREKEYNKTFNYLKNCINNQGPRFPLYVFGIPGTGKTVTTLWAISDLQKDKQFGNFDFIHFNAMQLSNPGLLYLMLCDTILDLQPNKKQSKNLATTLFTECAKMKIIEDHIIRKPESLQAKKSRSNNEVGKVKLVLLDECDVLFAKNLPLLCNLFNQSSLRNSQLIVIAIANAKLPKMFEQKIPEDNRLIYNPYRKQQIIEIISGRVDECLGQQQSVFSSDAIKATAKKVSISTGDMRCALQIANGALEIAKNDVLQSFTNQNKKLARVGCKHAINASGQLYDSKILQVLECLRKYEILVVFALKVELQLQQTESVLFDQVQDRCDFILKKISQSGPIYKKDDDKQVRLNNTIKQVPSNEFRDILKRLQSIGIVSIVVDIKKICENTFIQLNIFPHEIESALRCNESYGQFDRAHRNIL